MVIFPVAARSQSGSPHSADFTMPQTYRGILLHLNYSAESAATLTLDVKLQYFDEERGTFEDLTGVSFVQAVGVSEDDLQVYPGLTAAANDKVDSGLPRNLRAVATVAGGVAGDTVTFSLVGVPLT